MTAQWINLGRFLRARPVGMAPREVYTIHTRNDSDIIGMVEWYPRWREYVLQPERDAVFSVGCLHDLEVFLENLNRTGGA